MLRLHRLQLGIERDRFRTPEGTYRAVLVREGRTTYGWMLDRDLEAATWTPR